jgi:hypothetical protein
MMKQIAALAATAALGIAGCASTGTVTTSPSLPTPAEVIAATQSACNFVPTAASVAALVEAQTSSSSAVLSDTTLAVQLAQAICASVKAANPAPATSTVAKLRGLHKRKLVVTVGNVVITGTMAQ